MKNLLPLLFLFLLAACGGNDLQNAKASLKGSWTVKKVYSNQQTETGNLGAFTFSDTQLDYRFQRERNLKIGNAPWSLTREMVNSGFVKVEKYTLSFDGLVFKCAFGDETSDAEKNATKIRLESETEGYQLWLEKP